MKGGVGGDDSLAGLLAARDLMSLGNISSETPALLTFNEIPHLFQTCEIVYAKFLNFLKKSARERVLLKLCNDIEEFMASVRIEGSLFTVIKVMAKFLIIVKKGRKK